jgi:hypothetical protein
MAASFILLYSGHWIAYTYVHSKGLNDKAEFINVFLIQIFLIMPVTSIAVGIFIGALEQKSRWWMAGVALLPLLVFMLYRSFAGGLLFLSCIYLFLSLITSWFSSWLAHRKELI